MREKYVIVYAATPEHAFDLIMDTLFRMSMMNWPNSCSLKKFLNIGSFIYYIPANKFSIKNFLHTVLHYQRHIRRMRKEESENLNPQCETCMDGEYYLLRKAFLSVCWTTPDGLRHPWKFSTVRKQIRSL